MKLYLLAHLLLDVSIYMVVAQERDRVVWPKFNDDNSIPSRTRGTEKGDDVDDLIREIFGELNHSVTTPRQEEESEVNLHHGTPIIATNFLDDLEQFSAELYKTVSKSTSENVLLSPLSVNLALAMVAVGAEGNTKNEMLRTLHLSANDQLTKSNYENIMNNFKSITGANVTILNKVFINNNLRVKQTFKDVVLRNFHAEGQLINFNLLELVAQIINSWVSEGTNHKINKLINPGDLDSNTAMLVANIVYFKGEWKYKFTSVSQATFNSPKNVSKLVPTMKLSAELEYGYLRSLNAQFVELPYNGGELKMIIVLPNTVDGLDQVEKKLETMKLKTLRQNRQSTTVDLHLPKFRIENTINLNNILEEMGMKEMFTKNANLRGISEDSIQVSEIKQKTFIEVNEDGAEAAAVTVVQVFYSSFGNGRVPFIVNRPFHYKIVKTVNENDDIVLFAGNVKYIN